ncbi:vacuolar protein-sorting-associated protein 25 [Octopus bimaculoides]|uniref:Vacuolar protein-sorting-associated protein 25 n=1 Tax=Octopus bimaculoides TaxID=37653 RepID=A0A0L8GC03_OCTBM|nr:vacuolar protein-sorting-associated protein 25 [Octopus bimaculoides]|eukprot:XP_014782407.1 PREDICTED: vacuolar protein-sorting-associated protein 25-like [Octopus bimaculoides]
MAEFQWPWQYNFPPFFTIQPNFDTRKKQLEAWCYLILDYCKYHKIYCLDVTESQSSVLFYNKKLNRKLSTDSLMTILDELKKKGHLEWTDKSKRQFTVVWRSHEEWGKLIYKYITDNGMTDTMCTFYELTSGEDTVNKEFHGLEKPLLIKALKTLENEGKAELMLTESIEGVKFF